MVKLPFSLGSVDGGSSFLRFLSLASLSTSLLVKAAQSPHSQQCPSCANLFKMRQESMCFASTFQSVSRLTKSIEEKGIMIFQKTYSVYE